MVTYKYIKIRYSKYKRSNFEVTVSNSSNFEAVEVTVGVEDERIVLGQNS